MNLRLVADEAIHRARQEIVEFGLPTDIHFDLSLDKGRELASTLGASPEVVDICVAFMDFKLGEAFKAGRLGEHVAMSASAAQTFLAEHEVPEDVADKVMNAVLAHHGGEPFKSIEAEIAANADCYRFVHPRGVFSYLTTLGRRSSDFGSSLDQAESKMDEKYAILSLDAAKSELAPIYTNLKRYIAMARDAADKTGQTGQSA